MLRVLRRCLTTAGCVVQRHAPMLFELWRTLVSRWGCEWFAWCCRSHFAPWHCLSGWFSAILGFLLVSCCCCYRLRNGPASFWRTGCETPFFLRVSQRFSCTCSASGTSTLSRSPSCSRYFFEPVWRCFATAYARSEVWFWWCFGAGRRRWSEEKCSGISYWWHA